MAGATNKKLPVTKTGYQFQSEAELNEVKWLISQGDYKDLDDFGARMQKVLASSQNLNTSVKTSKKAA